MVSVDFPKWNIVTWIEKPKVFLRSFKLKLLFVGSADRSWCNYWWPYFNEKEPECLTSSFEANNVTIVSKFDVSSSFFCLLRQKSFSRWLKFATNRSTFHWTYLWRELLASIWFAQFSDLAPENSDCYVKNSLNFYFWHWSKRISLNTTGLTCSTFE